MSELDAALSACMERFREGRRAQDFEELYRHGRSLVLAWIVQALGRQRATLDPFDLVQDTFVNIFRYAAGFRHDDAMSFRRWARTIAGNVVRRAGRVRAGALAASSFDHETACEPTDPRPGPGVVLEDAEREGELRRAYTLMLLQYAAAYATLSPRDREALRLVEVEGLAYREVAERLQVGLSNTKMIVFRARQRLRARLEQGLAGQRAA
ncbi:MAG: sigma-70 family RNA polymerase sigma factor [Planctomycetota bacterium]